MNEGVLKGRKALKEWADLERGRVDSVKPPMPQQDWKEALNSIILAPTVGPCGWLIKESAVERLGGCDDFAQKQENLSPVCHISVVLPAFGGAPLPCAPTPPDSPALLSPSPHSRHRIQRLAAANPDPSSFSSSSTKGRFSQPRSCRTKLCLCPYGYIGMYVRMYGSRFLPGAGAGRGLPLRTGGCVQASKCGRRGKHGGEGSGPGAGGEARRGGRGAGAGGRRSQSLGPAALQERRTRGWGLRGTRSRGRVPL